MELQRGLRITSNVELVEPLGEGGMGTVWIADHLTLETQVAVKFISAELAGRHSGVLERFKREASIAAKIKSPHAVQIFDHGFLEDETPFIVMELLEGESLGDRLERGPLELAEVCLLVSQVAGVLSAAHQHGIVHRDIKPDNLFLIESRYALFTKVLDFGVAKQTQLPEQNITSTGAMIGTPLFMSPELVKSAKTADFHADLWALAVTAYAALTDRMPFEGETLGSLHIAIAMAQWPPPSEIRPALPAILDAWFARALARDPAARFQSADAMADALVQISRTADKLAAASTERPPALAAPNDGVPDSVRNEISSASGPAPVATQSASPSVASPHELAATVASQPGDPVPTFAGAARSVDSTPTHARPPRWRLAAALVASAAVAVVIVVVKLAGTEGETRPAASNVDASADVAAVESTQPVVEPSASSEATSPPVDERVTVSIPIRPANAIVTVDGKRQVLRDGALELTGTRGDEFAIVVQQGTRKLERKLSITHEGAPSLERLELPPVHVPARPPSPTRKPPPATPAPAPEPKGPTPSEGWR